MQDPILLPNHTTALTVRLFGDGSGHYLRFWLRDAEGELFTITAGMIGPPEWQTLIVPVGYHSLRYGFLAGEGNRRPDYPWYFAAIVIDDEYDMWSGIGEVQIDSVAALIEQE